MTTEPNWNAEDFDSWGDPIDWLPGWEIKAKVALIRHFSRIDLTVEGNSVDGWRFRVSGQSPHNVEPGHAETFVEAFLTACEAMAVRWDCADPDHPPTE